MKPHKQIVKAKINWAALDHLSKFTASTRNSSLLPTALRLIILLKEINNPIVQQSRYSLAKDLQISAQSIDTALKTLEKFNYIKIISTSKIEILPTLAFLGTLFDWAVSLEELNLDRKEVCNTSNFIKSNLKNILQLTKNNVKLVASVYLLLLSKMEDGKEVISIAQKDIAEHLQCSVGSVNKVLAILESQNIVAKLANSQYKVSPEVCWSGHQQEWAEELFALKNNIPVEQMKYSVASIEEI